MFFPPLNMGRDGNVMKTMYKNGYYDMCMPVWGPDVEPLGTFLLLQIHQILQKGKIKYILIC